MSTRLRIFSLLFGLAYLILISRLFYWQILKGKELSIEARSQYKKGYEISAERGEILASDNSWLAASIRSWLVYADLPKIEKPADEIAELLATFLVEGDDRKEIFIEIDRLKSLLKKDDVVWIALKQRVDSETKEKIEKLEIKGVGFEEGEMRAYPESSSSAHILGFVGKDEEGSDKGYFGLEGYYDLILTGKPGFLSRESDAQGIPILLGGSKEITAIGGVNLLTHIDKSIQLTLESKLLKGIERYGATAGLAIVMNPKNGAILGMSSYPSFEPGNYAAYSDELFKNPVISSTFEPGSILKVIVMASALDAKVVEPDTKCDACSGPLRVDKYTIETWDDVYYPNSTMSEVIIHSDNVGMSFVGKKLGSDLFYDYLKLFGFGETTGIDLQGEATPKLRERDKWNVVDLATASFGQGVAVTPIQFIKAVSVIANKGKGATPQVVDRLVKDGWTEDLKPKVGERVISEKAASEVTAMMVEAAKSGESKWTHARGFGVAGKTGTAQIPIAGHYDEEKTIASFVGFAPYYDPKFIMLITLREPASSPWASETAAPLWYDIAKELFFQFGIQPEN